MIGRHAFWAPLLAVMALGATAGAQWRTDDPSLAPRTKLAEFTQLLDDNRVIVLDVRDAEAYRLGHIPGAISMPLDTVERRAQELASVDKPIVAYCT